MSERTSKAMASDLFPSPGSKLWVFAVTVQTYKRVKIVLLFSALDGQLWKGVV